MSKKKIFKALLSIVFSVIIVVSLNVNTTAKPITKIKVIESTTKKQYTNIYSVYKRFKVPSSLFFWKKDTYYLYAKFNSAKKIMVKDITGAIEWNGPSKEVPYIDIIYSNEISVSKTTSVELTKNIGVGVSIKAVEVSQQLGGSIMNAITFEEKDILTLSTRVDEKSPKGYYGIIAAVNADLFNITLEKGDKTYTGKLLKLQSPNPYLTVYYSKSSY